MRLVIICELLECCFMVFRCEMLNCKNKLMHEQLINKLELELLHIHHDEVAADAISVHCPYDNTAAPHGAKAVTHPAAQHVQDDAKPAVPAACRNFLMGKCKCGDDCCYTPTQAHQPSGQLQLPLQQRLCQAALLHAVMRSSSQAHACARRHVDSLTIEW